MPPPVPSTPPPESVFDAPPVVVSVSAVRDIVASSDVSAVMPSGAARERGERRDPLLRVARVDPLPLPLVLLLLLLRSLRLLRSLLALLVVREDALRFFTAVLPPNEVPLRAVVLRFFAAVLLLREPVPLREPVLLPLREAVALRFFAVVVLRDAVVPRVFAAVVLRDPVPRFFAAVEPRKPELRVFAAVEPLELELRFFAAVELLELELRFFAAVDPVEPVLRFFAAVPLREVLLFLFAALPVLLREPVLRFFAAVLPLDDPRPLVPVLLLDVPLRLRVPDEPDEPDDFRAVVARLLALLRAGFALPPLSRALSSAIATACFCAFFFDDGRLFPIDPDLS